MGREKSLAQEIIKNRNLIFDLGKADFRKRFAGSYFGVVWMFIQPMVTIAIYAIIFGEAGFKSPPPVPGASYVVWMIPGLIAWFYFSEILNGLTGCLAEYNYLVKKVVFNVQLLPLIKLCSCLIVHLFFVLIMCVFYIAVGRPPELHWLQIFYYMFAVSVLGLGLGFFTAAVNVFFKDMSQIVAICIQFGIWMTPIMYHESIFVNSRPYLEPVFKLNPFYYISTGYRDSMLAGEWFFERPKISLYYWAVTLIIFAVGTRMFKKLRPHFSDVL